MALEIELVGEGPEREALTRLARSLGLEDRLRFRGWLRFPEVRQAMLDATVLVHPSIGLGDAVPTVIKEAMALGTPVVASNVAGIPELLADGECGVLVPPQDVGALASGIERLLRAPAERHRFAAAARQHVERTFDLAKNGPRLAELLRSTHRPLLMGSSAHAFET